MKAGEIEKLDREVLEALRSCGGRGVTAQVASVLARDARRPFSSPLCLRRLKALEARGRVRRCATSYRKMFNWEFCPPAQDLTEHQLKLARHALGLPCRKRETWRNHFVGPRGQDAEAWLAMVAAGNAVRREGSELTGGDPSFSMTRQGAQKALMPRERLGAQHFPIERANA